MKPRKDALGVLLLSLLMLSPFLFANTEEAAPPNDSGGSFQRTDLTCTMQDNNTMPCIPLGDKMPDRFDELMASPLIPDEFRGAAAINDLNRVAPTVMGSMPFLLMTHLSAQFLSTASPRGLAAVLRQHPGNQVLTQSVMSALDLVDNDKRIRFIRELGLNTNLGSEVQRIICNAAVRWWGADMTDHVLDLAAVGSPLLGAMPPGYLAELSLDHASDFLLQLRNHPWVEHNDPSWSGQPPETKRVWMEMFKKDERVGFARLTAPEADGLKMLWAGATPDEIHDLQYKDGERNLLTRLLHLTRLQVRAFMTKLFPKKALSSVEMNEVFDWMLELSPAGLQRFLANDTDFSNLPAAYLGDASLPTLKQVLEQVVANGVIQGRIEHSDDVLTWNRSLKDVGRLAFLIRPSQLAGFRKQRLEIDVLAAIDTYELSTQQTRSLTNDGEFVDLRLPAKQLRAIHGLLRAVPTSQLAKLHIFSVADDVLLHLIEAVPAANVGRSAAMFNKVRGSLGDARVLEAVLRNPTPGQYLESVSPREVDQMRAELERAYDQLRHQPRGRAVDIFAIGNWIDANLPKPEFIDDFLHRIPYDTMGAILGSARRELARVPSGTRRVVWNTDTLLSPVPDRPLVRGALVGLTCPDVYATDPVDFPYVVTTFNLRREAIGMRFPKRLHHCLQRGMEEYLILKRQFRRLTDQPLIKILEPSDIQAFGGYVLSTLRPHHVLESDHAEQILTAIGALSPSDLLSAVQELERLQQYALQVVDLYKARRAVGARCLFALGNLHMFLPPDVITAIDPAAWKLFVEAKAGRLQSLGVCAGSEQRDAWHRLTLRAFGSPTDWSAGVVAALGDLLAALPADVQGSVRMVSWRDAADTLADRTGYHAMTDVRGGDRTLPFAEACRNLLPSEEQPAYIWSVRRTVRHYLRALQALLDTVEPAATLVRRVKSRSARVYQPRARVASTSTTTTTTELSTTTAMTTTTRNPFDGFDLDGMLTDTPDWLRAATTTMVVPTPPKTVILRDDSAASTTDTPTESSNASTTPSSTASDASPSTVAPDSGLIAWDKAMDTLPALKSTAEPSSTATPAAPQEPGSSTAAPSAMNLPSLELSPAATAEPSKAEDSADKDDTEPASAQDGDGPLQRRKRRTHADEEMEQQVGRDVQVQPTCDGIRALGQAAALALVVGDAEHMLEADAFDCVDELSVLKLSDQLTVEFWAKFSPIRKEMVSDLGRFLVAMTPQDVAQLNLSLSHDRILDTLGAISQHVQDGSVISAVAEHLVSQNGDLLRTVAGSAAPTDAVGVDAEMLLIALGPVVCALPEDVRRMLLSRRGALLHAMHAMEAGHAHCTEECLTEILHALLADHALGDLATWTAEDVLYLGVFAAGLSPDQIKALKKPLEDVEQPLTGLTATAVACMSETQFQAIGEHIAVLTPPAAAAGGFHQGLTEHEQMLLNRVSHLVFVHHLGRPLPGESPDEDSLGEQTSSANPTRPGLVVAAVLATLWALLSCSLV